MVPEGWGLGEIGWSMMQAAVSCPQEAKQVGAGQTRKPALLIYWASDSLLWGLSCVS